jgi:hypothetical protein
MKPTPTTPFQDDWLTKFSGEHLFHELKMFWWLKETIPSHTDGYVHDALVESFVLHLRNLIRFFCLPRDRNDVVAEDFFDNPAAWTKNESPALRDARERANKELNHLTAKRRDEGDAGKEWDPVALFGEIKGLAEKFAANASRNKLHSKVRELVNAPAHLMVGVLAANSHASNVTAQVISVSAT